MYFIDTHTHLFVEEFDNDRKDVIKRALEANVTHMLLPNIDVNSIPNLLETHKEFPTATTPMIGLHPGSVDENYEQSLEIIHKTLLDHPFVAIGEIGMDLYWDKTFVKEQKIAFKTQILWSIEMNLPISIHSREAFDEIFQVLDSIDTSTLTGVFHCFTGNINVAEKILSYGGFKLGIGGVLTYKKSLLPDVIQQISIEHLILETDSPYLPPVPYRGKRNESAYIPFIANKIAEIKNIPIEDVAVITTKNACQLFSIPNPYEFTDTSHPLS